ncbi:hypothetical protein PG984_005191 [Apiospora sp. TS-2023a]
MANVEMENGFNSSKPSGLRPPQTKLPQLSSSTAQGLHEISESQSNTRMGPSANATSGVKRGLPPPVMQPEPKRKTLAEKASEFPGSHRSQIAAPTPARSFVKGTALKDIPASRPGSPSTSLELSSQAVTQPHDHSGFRRTFFRIPNRIKSFNIFVSWLNKEELGGKGVSLQLNANYSDHHPRIFQDDFRDVDWLDCLNVRQRL